MRFYRFTAVVIGWLSALGALGAADVNWSTYLGDAGGTHYSTLNQITPANVAKLQPAWTFHAGGADPKNRSQIQCNPLVIDGVLYGTSPDLALFALDAATGRELWRFTPEREASGGGPVGLNRGLTWWSDGAERRLMFSAGHFLHAIDPKNGKAIETFGDHGRIDLLDGLDRETRGMYLAANTPGAIFLDLIIMPMRLGEGPGPAAPGHIRAYDVRTGKRRWIFHTIPFPGEPGHETWSEDSWLKSGAANCWAGLVVDEKRGLAFVPTGSATFDFWGGDRLGDNLYANCLLALDAATGALKWHFQFTHHDLIDRDLPAPPVLCEVVHEGKKIAAVAQVTKSGHVWVFNRETGESLFPWREVPVPQTSLAGEKTSPTQPLPLKPAPFARQRFTEDEVTNRTPEAHAAVLQKLRMLEPSAPFTPPSERGTIILPGFDGGAEWGGAAVDPRGVLYVNANEMAWILQLVPTAVFGSGPKALYAQLCFACHGVNREGNPAANIPNLTAVGTRLKPEEIGALLRSGKGMMPSFSFLPAAARESLVRWLISPEAEEAVSAREAGGGVAPSAIRSPYVSTGYNKFLDPEGYPALRPPWGTLNAIDLNTGEFLWQKTLGEIPALTAQGLPPTGVENYGGPVVTAGGVLFIAATKDEMMRAFDAKTGEKLWEAPLPAGGYATPATYAVGGKHFVVIACGGGKLGTKSGDAYVAFALP
jgi:quinoprotein glucose dehydrogenase